MALLDIGRAFLLPRASGPVRLKGRTGSYPPHGWSSTAGISGDGATISPGLLAVAASVSDQVKVLPDRLGRRVPFLSRDITAGAVGSPVPAFSYVEAQMAGTRERGTKARLADDMNFRRMWASAVPLSAIAVQSGIAPQSVRRLARTYGYPTRDRNCGLLGDMSKTFAVDDPAQRIPAKVEVVTQTHPRWPVSYDMLILKTGGKYSHMAALAKTIGRSVNAILGRWHQLRPM